MRPACSDRRTRPASSSTSRLPITSESARYIWCARTRGKILGASAAVKALAILPFVMTIGLDALELLVAFLQAYVFAMLTCMYLNDALHPGH